jgi:hypothetical protein
MARSIPIALGLAIAASPAWGQSTAAPPASAHRYLLPESPDYAPETGRMWAGRELAPNARFGLGMFGLKTTRTQGSPVIVRDIETRNTRRAGVGLSLKF